MWFTLNSYFFNVKIFWRLRKEGTLTPLKSSTFGVLLEKKYSHLRAHCITFMTTNQHQPCRSNHGWRRCRVEEEEDLQEVHLQGCRPRPAPRHEQRAADGVVCLQDQEEVLQGTQEVCSSGLEYDLSSLTISIFRKPMALIKKLRKKKKEAPANEKPDVVKTHLRNMVIKLEQHDRLILMLISGHCPRDDWIHCWSLQRQGLHTGNDYGLKA